MIEKEVNPVFVKAVGNSKIYLKYSDGMEGELQLSYLKEKPGYEILKDSSAFGNVFIDEISKDICWNKNISICKNAVYKQLELINMMKRLGIELEKE